MIVDGNEQVQLLHRDTARRRGRMSGMNNSGMNNSGMNNSGMNNSGMNIWYE